MNQAQDVQTTAADEGPADPSRTGGPAPGADTGLIAAGEKRFRLWKLLAVLALVNIALAAIAAVIDIVVLGP